MGMLDRHMEPRWLLIILASLCLLFMISFVKVAWGDPIYPSMVGGDFVIRCVQPVRDYDADGIPLQLKAASCGVSEDLGVTILGCAPTPDEGVPVVVSFKMTATGQRASIRAYAFETLDCSGSPSEPSVNIGYLYPGMSPRPPDLNQ